jgi:hypothetical protein
MSTYTKTLKFMLVTNVGDEIPVSVDATFMYQPPEPETSTYPGCEERVNLDWITLGGHCILKRMTKQHTRAIEEDELARIKYERGLVEP